MNRNFGSTLVGRFALPCALALGALAASGPACSTDAGRPSLVSAGGVPSQGGRSGSASGDGGVEDLAGAAGADHGDSGATGDGGRGGEGVTNSGGRGGNPPAVPATCNQLADWSQSADVDPVASDADEVMLALTPDELDLAFLRDGALHVAHRSSLNAAFTVGPALTLPAGWSAAHGASLSADGKRLVLVSDPDQKKLGEWTRPNRETPFAGEIDTSAFAAVNQDSDFSGRVYASPIVSADDDQLFFNSAFLDADSTIVISSRSETGLWSAPRALNPGIFDGGAGQRRLPTGVSADGRTLFYFNEESGEQEARWRAATNPDSPLYDMRSLGARHGAVPNAACNRLYFDANGDVVVEKD